MRLNLGTVLVLSFAAAALLAGGCATPPRGMGNGPGASNLTPGMVKARIETGVTTQNDVLQVFGAPNIITRDSTGQEVWTYDVQYTATEEEIAEWTAGGGLSAGSGGLAGNAVIIGGGSVGGSSGRSSRSSRVSSGMFTLMVTFDNGDVVQDYRMMSSKF